MKLRIPFDEDVLNSKYLFEKMIDEEVLALLRNPSKVDTDLIEFLKLKDFNLYQKVFRANSKRKCAKKIGDFNLFVTARARLFYKKDSTSIPYRQKWFDAIIPRIAWLIGSHSRSVSTQQLNDRQKAADYSIREYREFFNEFWDSEVLYMQKNGLSANQSILQTKFSENHSIIVHLGLLRQTNRQIFKDLANYKKIDEKLKELAANEFSYKHKTKEVINSEQC